MFKDPDKAKDYFERLSGNFKNILQYVIQSGYHKKYTLIELLTTIALIVILISILIPSLNKTRDAARAITCLNNLRQTGLGTFTYAQDYNGSIIITYNSGTVQYPWSEYYIKLGYLSLNKITFCPAFSPNYYDRWRTYGIRVRFTQQPYKGTEYSITVNNMQYLMIYRLPMPAEYINYLDSISNEQQFYIAYTYYPGPGLGMAHLRHRGFSNSWFADGHAEAVGKSKFKELGWERVINQFYSSIAP